MSEIDLDGVVEKLHREALKTKHAAKYAIAASNFLNPSPSHASRDYVPELVKHYRRPDVLARVTDDRAYEDPEKMGLIKVLYGLAATVTGAEIVIAHRNNHLAMRGIAILATAVFGVLFAQSIYHNLRRYNLTKSAITEYLNNEHKLHEDLMNRAEALRKDIENYQKKTTPHPFQ